MGKKTVRRRSLHRLRKNEAPRKFEVVSLTSIAGLVAETGSTRAKEMESRFPRTTAADEEKALKIANARFNVVCGKSFTDEDWDLATTMNRAEQRKFSA